MPVTGLRGRQVLDGDITRSDINTSTAGSALIARIIAGTNISITSTGADSGTGDVTISATGTGLNGTGFVRMNGAEVSYITGTAAQFVKANGTLDSSVYLTSYTETDTLATVTGRGATTTTLSNFNGGINMTGATSSTGLNITSSINSGSGSVIRIAKAAAANQAYISFDTDQLFFGTPSNNTTDADVGTKGSVNLRLQTNYTTRINIGPTGTIRLVPLTSNGFLKTSGGDGTLTVDTATYLTGNQTITLSGDATGSGATAITVTLANSGVAAGTYTKVTVDAKGRVTTGASLLAADIPALNYLPIGGGTLTGNVIVWPGSNASYGAGFKFRNDTYAHYSIGVKGSSFVLANTGSDGTVVWPVSITDLITVGTSGNTVIAGTVTASSIIKSGGTSSQFLKADGSVDSTTYQSTSQKGQANGYASLDGAGKVPIAQLPSSIMEYKGTWNASTNSPSLADGTGDTGDVYRVSTAGTRNLGSGSITFDVGDYVIYNGTVWEKSDTTDAVASVNGLTGVITLTTTNIGEGTNLYYTDARARAAITLTTTGTSGAATYSGGVLNIPQYQSVLTNPVTGTGTTNYLSKFTGSTTIANSQIFDNATNVGIGTASPTYKLHVVGITNADDGFVNGQATFHKSVSLGNIGAGVTYTLGQLNFGSVYTHHFTVRVSSYAGTKLFTFIGYQSSLSKLVSGTPYQQSRFDALDVIIESVTIVGGEITGVKIGIKNGSAGEDYIYSATIECLSSFGGWTALASNTVLTPYSAGTSNYVVAQAGSVGVGTTSPTSKLNIVNGAATPGVKIEHSASGHAALWATTNEYGLLLQGTSTSSTFYLASISSGSVSRFYVRADGNIGIGTDTPSAKLVVNGTTWINQTTDYGGAASKVQISSGSISDNVVIRTNDLYLYNYGSSYSNLLRFGNGGETWNIGATSGTTPDFRLYEVNGASERLTIKAGGNVGIGTISPATKLHVSGGLQLGDSTVAQISLRLTRTHAAVPADAHYFVTAQNTPVQSWIEGGYMTAERAGTVTASNSGYPYYEEYAGQGSGTVKTFGFINLTTGNFTSANILSVFVLKRTGQLQASQYTSSSSFTGTAAGLLGFDSSGNVISIGTGTYLTAESDTLATVTGRGATTSTQVILNGGIRMGNAYLNPSGDLNHFHFNGTAIIPNTTTTASNASIGTASYRWSNLYGGGLDLSGSATISGNVTAAKYIVGSALGTSPIVVNGSANESQVLIKKSSQSSFSVLTWDGNIFLASNIYYSAGAWVHSAPASNNNNQLFVFTPGTGVTWYASNNGSGSWNVSNNITLWNDSGVWQRPVSSVSGTANYISKFTSTTAVGNSQLYDDGTTVGVGTSTVYSWAKLQVAGTLAVGGILYIDDDYRIQGLSAFPGAASKLILNSDGGNVGIGTTDPASKLHVTGATDSNPTISIGTINANTGNAEIDFYSGTAGSNNSFTLKYTKTSTVDRIGFIDGGAIESFVILNGGNVGIGTVTPTDKLSISGSTNAALGVRILNSTNNTAAYSYLAVGPSGSSLNIVSYPTNASTRAGTVFLNTDSGVPNGLLITTDAGPIRFSAASTAGSQMYLSTSGNLGLANTSPSYILDAASASGGSITTIRVNNGYTGASDGSQLLLGNSANFTNAYFRLNGGGNSSQAGIGSLNIGVTQSVDMAFYTNNVERIRVGGVGGVTITGTLTVTSTITEQSALRYKENVAPLTAALDKVDQLQPVSYNKKGSATKEIGLIAEDVFDVYPEFVLCDDNGEPVGIHYSRLTAVLIESVKELKKEINELKNRN